MRIKSGIIFTLLLFSTILSAQDKQAALEKYFIALHQNRGFSGNVLVAENGRVVYQKSLGYADFKNKAPNTPDISFPIASISKTLTATAILQLQEQGKLKVTDAVSDRLPGFPYTNMTIEHLLSHTSGMPAYNAFVDSVNMKKPGMVFTNRDFMGRLIAAKPPLVFNPGDKTSYDNTNYIVLSLIIEKLSGQGYEAYIKKNILQKAGMKDTRFFSLPVQYNTPEIQHFAYPHLYIHSYDADPVRAASVPFIKAYWGTYAFAGFGDYVSTVADLLKYDQALYAGLLLKKETLEQTFTAAKLANGAAAAFGWGWEIMKDTSLGKVVYHSGAATGLSCVIIRNISKQQTVILFDNLHYNARENGVNALRVLNNQSVPSPKKNIANVYGKTLLEKGPVAARIQLEALKKDTLNYILDEEEINLLGYEFLSSSNPYRIPVQQKIKEALETFKLNMELFPQSWNVYDSYGEALLADGQKEEAKKMYRKSVELNPDNEGGKKILEKLSAE